MFDDFSSFDFIITLKWLFPVCGEDWWCWWRWELLITSISWIPKDFINICSKKLSINLIWKNKGLKEIGINKDNGKIIINVSKRYFRETEVDNLIGDYKKAKKNLNWKPKYSFEKLIEDMIANELWILF